MGYAASAWPLNGSYDVGIPNPVPGDSRSRNCRICRVSEVSRINWIPIVWRDCRSKARKRRFILAARWYRTNWR